MNANKHSKKVVHLPKFIQKNHTAILFSLLLFLMLPVTFVHAQRLYTTDGVNVRAKPNSSSKVLTSVSAGTSVTKTGRSGNWIAVRVNGIKGYIYKSYLSGSKNTSTATVSKSTIFPNPNPQQYIPTQPIHKTTIPQQYIPSQPIHNTCTT